MHMTSLLPTIYIKEHKPYEKRLTSSLEHTRQCAYVKQTHRSAALSTHRQRAEKSVRGTLQFSAVQSAALEEENVSAFEG